SRWRHRDADPAPDRRALRNAAPVWPVRTARIRPRCRVVRTHHARHPVAMFGRLRAPRRPRVPARMPALAAVAASAFLALSTAPVSASDFPSWDSGYHSYTEMVTEIQAVAKAHPDIVKLVSMGTRYQKRTIRAANMSDHANTDEPETEVLFDALHHAREHLTVEQALYLFHLLVDGYGTDPQITGIVNNTEIWIIFAVNPDGFEYDLTCTGS